MERELFSSGTPWEPIVGYSRAVKVGDRIWVSGTTATDAGGKIVGKGDAYAQTRQAIANIERALTLAGARLGDVVRTRVYVRDATRWEPVAHVHARYFGEVRPVNTLVQIGALVGDCEIEIEAEAEVGA